MADCEGCKKKVQVEDVPYIAHEAALARAERMAKDAADRQERTIKKLWKAIIALIIVICLCVGGLIGMFIYETQFEDVVVEQDVDTGEGDAFVAGVGDINYGESETAG